MQTASERLNAKIDLAYPSLIAQAEQLWSGPAARDVYPVYLTIMHMVVRSAVPLLESALAEARARGAADALAARLVPYLASHIPEETGHADWLLEDLAAAGADPDEPLRRVPPAVVATMVGAQYYWLRHCHPVSLLGHIMIVEGRHPPAGFAAHLRERTGLPAAAFRTIERHETLDIHHKRELCALMDSLPLQAAHEELMAVSAFHTVESGIGVLAEIARLTEERLEIPAAGS